jgi:hypothetical protein
MFFAPLTQNPKGPKSPAFSFSTALSSASRASA